MARWSPTVLPYAPDPFEAGDRIARGIYGGVQLDQGQQRLDDMKERTDIYAQNSELSRAAAEAGMHDQYGYEGPHYNRPDRERPPPVQGNEPETAGLPTAEQGAPAKPVRLQSDYGGPPVPIGAQPGPQYATGDVRNQPEVVERYQLATGGSIAPMGQRPADIHAASERRRIGEATYDYLGPLLDLPPEARDYMTEVSPNLPGLKPHQREGYATAEEAARDSYLGERVKSPVLAAIVRARSAEGGGGFTAAQQLDIYDAQFANNVYQLLNAAQDAGRQMGVEEAYEEVRQRMGYQGSITMDELARGLEDLRSGDFEGYGVPSRFTGQYDTNTIVSVKDAIDRLSSPAAGAADLQRILAENPDPEWQNLFWQVLAMRQQASLAERYGIPLGVGVPQQVRP